MHYAQNNNDLVLKPVMVVDTFMTIQSSWAIRQEHESDALCRDDICCNIPMEFARVHAVHQWCYKQNESPLPSRSVNVRWRMRWQNVLPSW